MQEIKFRGKSHVRMGTEIAFLYRKLDPSKEFSSKPLVYKEENIVNCKQINTGGINIQIPVLKTTH